MATKWHEILVAALIGPITAVGRDQLSQVLDKWYESKPEQYKAGMVGLYAIVDLQLEPITDTSKTKIDDPFVDALKGAIEDSAQRNGLVLQNLDND